MTQIDEFAFSETNYQINDQGKVVRQPRFVSLQQSIRLTTRLASRLNTKVDIRFNTSGWDALLKSVKVRNRITHPKSKDDLHIGDAEAEACLDALFWLLEAIANGMGAANAALALHTADFRNTLNALNRGDTKTWTAYREALLADDD